MNYTLLTAILNLILFGVSAHMELSKPLCRKSKYNKNLEWFQIDYMNMFPLGNFRQQDFPYPCRGFPEGNITETLVAGGSFLSRISGDVPHNGGHCEWSISFNEKKFVVINTIVGDCLTLGKREYMISLPSTLPKGRAVLAWTWINRTGIREFYMNCADVMIESPLTSGYVTGPEPVIANLPGFPLIPQFTEGLKGQEFYEERTNITLNKDSRGRVFMNELKASRKYRVKLNNTAHISNL